MYAWWPCYVVFDYFHMFCVYLCIILSFVAFRPSLTVMPRSACASRAAPHETEQVAYVLASAARAIPVVVEHFDAAQHQPELRESIMLAVGMLMDDASPQVHDVATHCALSAVCVYGDCYIVVATLC